MSEDEAEQLRVQLAGCLTAAEGGTMPEVVAVQGDYGWSPAYQKTLELRRECDAMSATLRMLRKWDMLDACDDGPWAKRLIDEALERPVK